MDISLEENVLTAEQALMLRTSVGWQGILHQLEIALKNGLFNVAAKDGNKVVGMGRLVGDGVVYWYVQDLAVLPDYQGKGIGKRIMLRLIEHVKQNSLPDTSVTVGLMSAKGKELFYEKFGFTARPNETYGAGMMNHYKIDEL